MTGNGKLHATVPMEPADDVAFPPVIGHYAIESTVLGVGNSAVVRLGTHIPTGEKVALKLINKKSLSPEDTLKIHREITISQALRHSHVIRTYQTVENADHVAVVMEYASGGEVFTQLTNRGRYDEPEARRLFRQIVAALRYCHSLHVVHRDLKTENLLLDDQQNIKLADFGFSDVMKPGDQLDEWCGSLPYAAPELFHGYSYDGFKSDSWSLGIVLYVMVTGNLPFDGESLAETQQRILDGMFSVPAYVSDGCASLLRALLVVDPTIRCDLDNVIRHPWLCFDTTENMSFHSGPEDSLLGDHAPDDSELNEFVLDEMERLGHTRNTVRVMVASEPFHDISVTYHLLNDRFSRKLITCSPIILTSPIPISQDSSRRSSILTGIVVREGVSPDRRSSSSPTTASSTCRRSSLPPTLALPAGLLGSFSWPLTTPHLPRSFRGLRRSSDGAISVPPVRFRSQSSDVSDVSLTQNLRSLSMEDSDEEPDMEAVQRYLSIRGKATRHTVGSSGKRPPAVATYQSLNSSPTGMVVGGPRRHSDNPASTVSGRQQRSPRIAYLTRPISPVDEMTILQRQLDSGFGSPSSCYSHSPAILSPQRQSLCNGPSPHLLAVPCAGTFPARLNAAFSSPSFLDKLYGGIRIRVTGEEEILETTNREKV